MIAAGKVLSTRIVRTVIGGRDTYRVQLVCDGDPTAATRWVRGRCRSISGQARSRWPCNTVMAPGRGGWSRWPRRSDWTPCGYAAISGAWIVSTAPAWPTASIATAPISLGVARGRSHAATRTASRVSELHRRLAEHRKTLHGALANRLLGHGTDIACEKLDYVAWQKNFPRSVRDRAPGMLVETIRRKAESAGGDRLFEFTPRKRPPCPKPACAGIARKSRSPNGSTAAGAASKSIGTCSRPTSDCTSEPERMV